jgi:hypothetical protein
MRFNTPQRLLIFSRNFRIVNVLNIRAARLSHLRFFTLVTLSTNVRRVVPYGIAYWYHSSYMTLHFLDSNNVYELL